jgi:hypothetical protein
MAQPFAWGFRSTEPRTLGGVSMKKVFTILMVVSVLGMLIGCAPKEEAAPEGGAAPTGTEAPK